MRPCSPRLSRYYPISNVWTDVGSGNFTADKTYVVQTNNKIIERCVLMSTDPGDLVLDPTRPAVQVLPRSSANNGAAAG
ncbi:MAG: DNA methyltransferase [Pseudonocardia sp.]